MKKITKKEVNEFIGTKDSWSPFGWKMWQTGAYIKNDEIKFYRAYHGQGLNEVVYNGTYDMIIDLTEEITEWLDGEYTKTQTADYILEKINSRTKGNI